MQGFTHPSIETLVMDVTQDDQVNEVVRLILDREGKIDILVNNAGVIGIGERLELTFRPCSPWVAF
jgi:1-acylglycerone phosphate reductase